MLFIYLSKCIEKKEEFAYSASNCRKYFLISKYGYLGETSRFSKHVRDRLCIVLA